ncbi:hypothetical protein [Chryseobacterium sp. HR92]|uniref:hypothetical protein n=1 Tax=Chryseobacterium sp. HR92 TaxID=3094839 RepID=UPI0038904A42|nr:hypothetical protein SFA27_13565 [Chryseobacterium sp. HR92]
MKITTFIVLLATGFSAMAAAQQKKEKLKIPLAVEKAFQKSHPSITAKWEEEDGKYEAGFKQNGKKMSILYSAAGVLEESETEIAISQLPPSVAQYTAQHKLGNIKEAAKITKADGTVLYEAEVKGGDALFDTKGNFVKLQKD